MAAVLLTRAPLFILSGPSGVGKTTLIDRLLRDPSWPLRLSVSVTTRDRRPREENGVHYHFWTRAQFEAGLNEQAFLEWANVYGNYYGTLRSEVDPHRDRGVGVLLDIDTQGWEQVKRLCPDAVSIFIRTALLETFALRLRERGTETEAAIRKRLEGATRELARAPEYDYQVINDDLETALKSLSAIVAERFAMCTANKH